MKNLTTTMKNTILVLGGMFLCTLWAFKPEPKPVMHQTIALVCTTPEIVKQNIELYSKQGWNVKELVCQTVATSVNSRTNTSSAYDYPQRDLYGKFVLILEK